jgi:hypothetical protein
MSEPLKKLSEPQIKLINLINFDEDGRRWVMIIMSEADKMSEPLMKTIGLNYSLAKLTLIQNKHSANK